MNVEDLDRELEMMFGKQSKDQQKVDVVKIQSSGQQNSDNEQMIRVSQFRASDPTIIDRRRIMGFEKKGQLLQRIKRELSSKNLDIQLQPRTHKRVNTHLNIGQSNIARLKFISNDQNDDQQQMIADYQKRILDLKVQLDNMKQEKRQLKQTLQNQRRFFMSEMYNKEVVVEKQQQQITKLNDEIQRRVGVEYQMQERIRELELQNKQYKYQLQRLQVQEEELNNQLQRIEVEQQIFKYITDQNQSSYQLSPNKQQLIDSQVVDFHQNILLQPIIITKLQQNNDEVKNITLVDQSSTIIQKLQTEIKQIRQFYQGKLVALQQLLQMRNHSRTLTNKSSTTYINNQQQHQQKKNYINGQDQSRVKLLYEYLIRKVPSIEFLKGFGIGTLLISIGATLVYRKLSKA